MNEPQQGPARSIPGYYRQYRRSVWLAGALVVYSCLGFLLAPWLIRTNMIGTVRELYGADLRLERVALNPFVLSLRLEGVELDAPDGDPILRLAELFVNFQLSSLFRWAYTFDEVRVAGSEFFVARGQDGRLNLELFVSTDDSQPVEARDAAVEAGLPRLHVFQLSIEDASIDWRDAIPLVPVETRFGPIDIVIADLSTLPDRSGRQSVVITTESEGTLSWSGSLNLNPLSSAAHAAIKGSHFPLMSAYVREITGFDIPEGIADIEFDYRVETPADGSLTAAVENLELRFDDVVVRTFSNVQSATGAADDHEVLRLPGFHLAGGAMRWPEKQVSIAAVTLDDPSFALHRYADGSLNVDRRRALRGKTIPSGASGETEPGTVPDETAWQLALDRLAVNRFSVSVEDQGVQPAARVGITELGLAVEGISNAPGARFPLTLSAELLSGGLLQVTGDVAVLPEVLFDFELSTEGIELAGAHPYITPLADVNLESGVVNLTGRVSGTADEPFAFSGDFDIAGFEITESDEGSRLGSWRNLALRNVRFSTAARKIDVSAILLDQAYGDILIAEDGSLNLGRVARSDVPAEEPEAPGASDVGEGGAPEFAVNIGKIELTNAGADFADLSLPLPFAATIRELNGNLTTVSTASNEPSSIALEGKVDDYGFVNVGGHVTPLDPASNTDIRVSFQNVQMPKFTAYTVPFAGREIASGSLDLDLGYRVNKSQLVGENSITLRDFELGDKVPHPDAMSLPLGLAVALLKDPSGRIDIDLPVRGDLNDPEFSYGGVIGKALVNLIVKVVASPFSLLGNLLGIEADELEYLNFIDGRAGLTPPELERAAKLAEALSLRPELQLEISGVVDMEADGLALRTTRLDALVEQRIADIATDGGEAAMYAEQRRQVLETLYTERPQEAGTPPDLDAIRARFTSQPEPADGEAAPAQFDALAYANELRRLLIESLPLPDASLSTLARERAGNARAAIVAVDPALADRIVLGELRGVTRKRDEPVRMKVSLSARN